MSEQEIEKTPSDENIFQSAEQLSAVKGISKHVIKLAKARKAPGFVGTRIYWDQFEPYYLQHKDELESVATESLEQFKKELVKWQSEKARLEVQQLKGNQLDREDVKAFFRSYNSAAHASLADIPNDWQPKFTGLTTEQANQRLKELVIEINSKLNSLATDEWVRKQQC